MTVTMSKEERLHLRASQTQKSLLLQASEATGRSISDFVLEAAVEKAQDALLDQRIFTFTTDEYDAFVARANDVEKNRAAVQKLMERKAPWES
jgi:uncharacterized protein (DUF1778 family)